MIVAFTARELKARFTLERLVMRLSVDNVEKLMNAAEYDDGDFPIELTEAEWEKLKCTC